MNEQIERAGVIPFIINANNEIEMLFMQPSDPQYGGDKFQIAKGKIEQGEQPKEAAFREAQEELGLFMPNVIESACIGVFGTVEVHVAQIQDKNMFGEPDFETGAVTWMTPDQFQSDGREWQRPIVKAAVRKINSMTEE